MTREERISALANLRHAKSWKDKAGIADDTIDTCIELLEQEPCEDAIDRAEAMTVIMMFAGNVKPDEENIYIKVSDAVQLLRELPSVTPQTKTGHWIYDRTRDWDGECKYECSCCGMGSDVDYAYCMRCGAKMTEQQESEDKE